MVQPALPRTTPETPPRTLTADEESQFVADWQEILDGKRTPGPMPIPAEVEAVVKEEESRLPCRLTPAARRRLREDHALSFLHGGGPVVCLETPSGRAILAAGDDQVALLQERLPLEYQRRVGIFYPPVW